MIIGCENCGVKLPAQPFRLMTKCACGHENWHPIHRGPKSKIIEAPPPFKIKEDKT